MIIDTNKLTKAMDTFTANSANMTKLQRQDRGALCVSIGIAFVLYGASLYLNN